MQNAKGQKLRNSVTQILAAALSLPPFKQPTVCSWLAYSWVCL